MMKELTFAILYEVTYQRERSLSHWYSRRKCATDFFPMAFLRHQSPR